MYANHSFHKAIRLNKIRCIKRMLKHNEVGINTQYLGLTWIHHCIIHSNSTFELIVNHPNIDPNIKSQIDNLTPLMFAIKQQDITACLSLISNPNTIIDDTTLKSLLTFVVDYGTGYNLNNIIMEVLENPKCNIVVIPNYAIFASVLSSSKVNFNNILTAITHDNNKIIQPEWYAKYLNKALLNNYIVGIDRLIQLDRKLVDEIIIHGSRHFIFAFNIDCYSMFELFVKHKLNPNVAYESGISLLYIVARGFADNNVRHIKYLKLLLTYPDINVSNIVDNKGRLPPMPETSIEVLLSNPKFRVTTPIVKTMYMNTGMNIVNITIFNELCTLISSLKIHKKLLIKFITEIMAITKQNTIDKKQFYYDNCNRHTQWLIDSYLQYNNILYQWIADIQEPILFMFVLTVLLCDEYLVITPTDQLQLVTKEQQSTIKWFNIARQLPMELQMLLSHRTFGSNKQFVHIKVVNCVASNLVTKYHDDDVRCNSKFNHSNTSPFMSNNIITNHNTSFDNTQTYGLPSRTSSHGTLPVQSSIHQ